LREMKKLEGLVLEGPRVTPAGIGGLHRALPKLRILWEGKAL
jgi:hypothetical protein